MDWVERFFMEVNSHQVRQRKSAKAGLEILSRGEEVYVSGAS
jgi:hypothetical protein